MKNQKRISVVLPAILYPEPPVEDPPYCILGTDPQIGDSVDIVPLLATSLPVPAYSPVSLLVVPFPPVPTLDVPVFLGVMQWRRLMLQ